MRVPDNVAPGLAAVLARAAEVLTTSHATDDEADPFMRRLVGRWPDLEAGLRRPYADEMPPAAYAAFVNRLIELLAHSWLRRPATLRSLDAERELTPDWFQRPEMIGYSCYVDRFAADLRGVADHIDHLADLGITYLHLMPLLATRDGDNDGGYAVADYRRVAPTLGTMEDLSRLTAVLRERGISVCTDLVLNHCAVEHEWAQRALAGDPDASAMFYLYPDRDEPDRFEATLPEVFPEIAPGSFTRLGDGRWVWTTFNSFQWDLNWTNPRVFCEMVDILLNLANHGVEVLRLDAVAFMWKRMGTNCQNQPEVHDLMQALRACTRIAAPAVIHKAEAIVGPQELIPYLGVDEHAGKVCDLAYHNSLMVQFWAALASEHTGLMNQTLRRFPAKPRATAWIGYVRCHDDIGWSIPEDVASSAGIADAGAHRRWLADFYAGLVPGSFARGAHFQDNPETGDRRTSGAAASLAGLESALDEGDDAEIDLAIRRILLGYALIYGSAGLPVIWMGDELGLSNAGRFREAAGHASDNRWMHRPLMDWPLAGLRHLRGSPQQRLFDGIAHLGRVRAATRQLHAAVPLDVVPTDHPRLFVQVRDRGERPLVALHSFSRAAERIQVSTLPIAAPSGRLLDLLTGRIASVVDGAITLGPYGVLWLVEPAG